MECAGCIPKWLVGSQSSIRFSLAPGERAGVLNNYSIKP